MEVTVEIDNKVKDISINIYYFKDKYIIELLFPSKEVYLKFLNEGKIKQEYFVNIENNGFIYLKNNIKTFKELLYSTKISYVIRDFTDLNKIPEKENIILDISNLSWSDKLLIINNITNNNIYFKDEYTLDEVLSLNDILCMYNIISDIANTLIDKSPLEQVYSIYNLLKERPYDIGNEDNIYESRSLNQILYTNPIVCSGFVNYSKAITDALGINSEKVSWQHKDEGHVSSIYFINDSKHNIIGIFALDITADSQKFNRIKHYLYPMDIAINEMTHFGFKYNNTDNIYFSLLGSYQRLQTFRKHFNEESEIIIREKELLAKKINKIYKLLNINKQIDINSNIDKEIEEIKKFARTIILPLSLKSIINSDNTLDNETCLELIKTSFHYQALPSEDKLLTDVLLSSKGR